MAGKDKEKQMEEEITSSSKDIWDKLDILGSKFLIPIVLALIPILYSYTEKEGDAKMKTLELVIGILNVKSSDTTNNSIRKWASNTFEKITDCKLPSDVKNAVDKGKPLIDRELQLSNSEQLRVVIIYLRGKDTNAVKLRTKLENAGYSNIILFESSQEKFPQNSEVRFYYPGDSQNAKTLSDYIKKKLQFDAEPVDKSLDEVKLNKHQLGELHIYLR